MIKYCPVPTNFFDTPEVEWVMNQENGAKYIVMYQKLCIAALKAQTNTLFSNVDGFLRNTPVEQELMQITGYTIDIIRMGLIYLAKVKLIHINDDKSITIPGLNRFVAVPDAPKETRVCTTK